MPRLVIATCPLLAVVVSVALAAIPPALHAAPAATASPGPTLAREDTLHTSVPEVLVRAPRVTLDEILDRIARGERRRDSLLVDESFVATVRVMRARDDHSPPVLSEESVYQVYRRKPNQARTLLLRRWREKPKKDSHQVEVSFRSDMSEEVVNFAFRPEARRQYRYHIEGRDILGNHVVYRIRFEPKSLLDPGQPSGLVWVDTNDFVIVRQEIEFERSPIPLIVKNIDRMVIERERVGNFWMLRRVLMRAHFTIPLPTIGRRMDLGMQFDHYALNSGLPDSLFDTVERP